MAEAVASGGTIEHTVRLSFHGVESILTIIAAPRKGLSLELEQEVDDSRWRGDFTPEYIETMCRRMGNFKPFDVFVKMLLTALTQDSDTVFVDLLTFADLEKLKQRKSQQSIPSSSASAASRNQNKRYLILTYAAEFDRVNYPLPLAFEETPSSAALLRTIKRLKKEMQEAKDLQSHALEPRDGFPRRDDFPPQPLIARLKSLQVENEELKRKLQDQESITLRERELRTELTTLKGHLRNVQVELKSSEERRVRAEQALAQTGVGGGGQGSEMVPHIQETVSSLREELVGLETSFQQEVRERQKVEEELLQARRQVVELNKKLSATSATRGEGGVKGTGSRQQVSKLRVELRRLQRQLGDSEKEKENLRRRLQATQTVQRVRPGRRPQPRSSFGRSRSRSPGLVSPPLRASMDSTSDGSTASARERAHGRASARAALNGVKRSGRPRPRPRPGQRSRGSSLGRGSDSEASLSNASITSSRGSLASRGSGRRSRPGSLLTGPSASSRRPRSSPSGLMRPTRASQAREEAIAKRLRDRAASPSSPRRGPGAAAYVSRRTSSRTGRSRSRSADGYSSAGSQGSRVSRSSRGRGPKRSPLTREHQTTARPPRREKAAAPRPPDGVASAILSVGADEIGEHEEVLPPAVPNRASQVAVREREALSPAATSFTESTASPDISRATSNRSVTAEISDLDRRLQSLQSFLSRANAGTA